MLKYATENKRVRVLLINDKFMSGDINIVGFERLSDFINNNKDSHISLTNVMLNGKSHSFMMLNKNNVIGYFEEND